MDIAEVSKLYGMQGVSASIDFDPQYVLLAPFNGVVEIPPVLGDIYYPKPGVAKLAKLQKPIAVIKSADQERFIYGQQYELATIEDALKSEGFYGFEDEPRAGPPWADNRKELLQQTLYQLCRWQVLAKAEQTDLPQIYKNAKAVRETNSAPSAQVSELLAKLRTTAPPKSPISDSDLLLVLEGTSFSLAREWLLPAKIMVRVDRLRYLAPNSQLLLGKSLSDISIQVPRLDDMEIFSSAVNSLRTYWSNVAKYELHNDEDRKFLSLLTPDDPLEIKLFGDPIEIIVADCEAADKQAGLASDFRSAYLLATTEIYWEESLGGNINHALHALHPSTLPPKDKQHVAERVARLVESIQAEPKRSELLRFLAVQTRDVMADHNGTILKTVEDRADFQPGDVDFPTSFTLFDSQVPLDLDHSEHVLANAPELGLTNEYRHLFRLNEYRAALNLSAGISDVSSLGERHAALRLKRAINTQLELDQQTLANQLRSTRSAVTDRFEGATELYDDGRLWVTELAEVNNVYVTPGQYVNRGDQIASVIPAYERKLWIEVDDGSDLAEVLTVGTRLDLSFSSTGMLPLTMNQKNQVLQSPKSGFLKNLLSALNSILLSVMKLPGEVVSRTPSVINNTRRLRIVLRALTPEEYRRLVIPKVGINGASQDEIVSSLSAIGCAFERVGSEPSLLLQAGVLSPNTQYLLDINMHSEDAARRLLIEAEWKQLKKSVSEQVEH